MGDELTAPDRWYRVFYRNDKSEAVLGEPALARILARKVPTVIHHELAIIHRCQACGRQGPWMPGWVSYPVLAWHPEAVQARAGATERYIACGRECWADITQRAFDIPAWMNANREPDRDQARNRALFEAQGGERQRKREVVDHRKVPMIEWRGQGYCKWCNGPMTAADRPSTMWHPACAAQWKLHALLSAQIKFVIARDGPICAVEGCTNRGCELDHHRPLWSVRDLPAGMRRAFYGPINLRWLCFDCHKAKSRREAAQRAAERRQVG